MELPILLNPCRQWGSNLIRLTGKSQGVKSVILREEKSTLNGDFTHLDNPVYQHYLKEESGIYRIYQCSTTRCYIGQSVNLLKRLKEHRDHYLKQDTPLYKAIRKWGLGDFHWEILHFCPREELNDLEIREIDRFQSYYQGFNQTLGGEDNPSSHPEIVKKRTHTLLNDPVVNQKLRLIGEENPRSILTETQVLEMRRRYDQGESAKQIYQDFQGVLYSTFESALYGRSWGHLPKIKKRVKGHRLMGQEVFEIRQLVMQGVTSLELQERFNTTYEQMRRIIKCERWLNQIPEGYEIK